MIKFRHLLLLFLGVFSITGLYYVFYESEPSTVKAFGELTVDLGVPSGDPIFVVSNMVPGDCTDLKNIHVTNSSDTDSHVAVRSANVIDDDNLADVLSIKITEGIDTLYDNTLDQFFATSGGLDGTPLSVIPPTSDTTYTFQICMEESAGNEYQNTETIFDLIFGEVISEFGLPEECSHLEGIITNVIEGTEGNDRIRGTHASELILGYGGRDRINGKRGNDCIVGGDGRDKIDGGEGDDVLIGGLDKDDLDGGEGEDIIYGNEGDDKIKGGDDNDLIYGGPGKDRINGNSSDDEIYGGDDDDRIDGGSGSDELYGESGDDEIEGGPQDDFLDGGPDEDELDGDAGQDTCVNGESYSQCELP